MNTDPNKPQDGTPTSRPQPDRQTPMERSTGNRKYLREEDCEDNDEGA